MSALAQDPGRSRRSSSCTRSSVPGISSRPSACRSSWRPTPASSPSRRTSRSRRREAGRSTASSMPAGVLHLQGRRCHRSRAQIPEECKQALEAAGQSGALDHAICIDRASSSARSPAKRMRAARAHGATHQGLLRRAGRLPRPTAASTSTRTDTINISGVRVAQRLRRSPARAAAARPRSTTPERARSSIR